MKTKTKITTTMLLIATGLAVLCMPGVSEADTLVTDPDDVGNDINTLNHDMSEEVGNTSLASFNKLGLQRTFTMDSTASPSYPTGEVNNDSFVLTEGGSGEDKTLNMSRNGTGFWSLAGFGAGLSSGDQTIVRGTGVYPDNLTSTFTFNTAVQAFGFTLNRFVGDDLTVNLYSDSGGTAQIATFAMSDNTSAGGTGHSFFGYTSAASNILRIDLVATGVTQQFGIDDVSFARSLAGTVITIQ